MSPTEQLELKRMRPGSSLSLEYCNKKQTYFQECFKIVYIAEALLLKGEQDF